MTWRNRWVVLAPGEAAWLEKRTREILEAEPVYAIEGNEEWQSITRFLKGEETYEDQEPEELVRALGCVMPWRDEPPRPLKIYARTVALIKGVSKDKVLRVLEKEAGHPLPPGYYRLEETFQGLLLGDGFVSNFALATVAERYPRATVFSVTARPDFLERFHVQVMRGRRIEEFSQPPASSSLLPIIHEVAGERTPERILAALGIPREWFRLPEEGTEGAR